MAGNLVTVPFVVFHDITGQPIDGGYIYVGEENLDTVSNPVSAFWDEALTIPATQPIRTVNGYPARNGSPGNLYVAEAAFSMLVKTVRGSTAFSRASMKASGVAPGWVNAKGAPFYAMGDGVTDDTAALQAAIDYAFLYGCTLFIPYGIYMVTSLYQTVTSAGKGPVKIVGDSAPNANATAGRGTQIKQIEGNTGPLFYLTGNWSTGANKPIAGVSISDISFRTSSTNTDWALDFFNLTNRHNDFRNISIYVPSATAAGAWRCRSCWASSFENIELYGPDSGTVARGLVLTGTENEDGDGTDSTSDGTSNMILLKNINAQYFGACGIQLGKWTESAGGFAHSYTLIGGQVGRSQQYGIVIARVLDCTLIGFHTELNKYSGFYFDDDAGGVDPNRCKMINCDSIGDGYDATADTADSYALNIRRGQNIEVDGYRMQSQRAGIYIADSTDTTGIQLDNILFGGNPDNVTSRTALYVANATPTETKRLTLGFHTFGNTWGNGGQNVIENPGSISHRILTEQSASITDANGFITIYPWSSSFRLAAMSTVNVSAIANNGTGRIRVTTATAHGLVTGDSCVIASVVGTTEANGAWTVTTISATQIDLQKSVYVNAYISGGTVKIRQRLLGFSAATNYSIATGQKITLYFNSTDTNLIDVSSDSSSLLNLLNSSNWIPQQGDTVSFIYRDGFFTETGRSLNSPTVGTNGNNTTITLATGRRFVRCTASVATSVSAISTEGSAISDGQSVDLLFTTGNTTLLDVTNGGCIRLQSAVNATFTVNDVVRITYDTGATATAITAVTNNGSGAIRVTAVGHGLVTGNTAFIASVVGTTEANGEWQVTRISNDVVDLIGSDFVNIWTSGGTIRIVQWQESARSNN